MKDNDIKVLEWCRNDFVMCEGCIIENECNERAFISQTLDLIEHQKAEIKRLQKIESNILNIIHKNINKAQIEIVREFAERLKEKPILRAGYVPWYDIQEVIDDLEKEMESEKWFM